MTQEPERVSNITPAGMAVAEEAFLLFEAGMDLEEIAVRLDLPSVEHLQLLVAIYLHFVGKDDLPPLRRGWQ